MKRQNELKIKTLNNITYSFDVSEYLCDFEKDDHISFQFDGEKDMLNGYLKKLFLIDDKIESLEFIIDRDGVEALYTITGCKLRRLYADDYTIRVSYNYTTYKKERTDYQVLRESLNNLFSRKEREHTNSIMRSNFGPHFIDLVTVNAGRRSGHSRWIAEQMIAMLPSKTQACVVVHNDIVKNLMIDYGVPRNSIICLRDMGSLDAFRGRIFDAIFIDNFSLFNPRLLSELYITSNRYPHPVKYIGLG